MKVDKKSPNFFIKGLKNVISRHSCPNQTLTLFIRLIYLFHKGPFMNYVDKQGGGGLPNVYVTTRGALFDRIY